MIDLIELIFLLGAIAFVCANLLQALTKRPLMQAPLKIREKVYSSIEATVNESKYRDLRISRDRHEVASVMSKLVEEDGAGAWPPNANHDSWPAALRPYQDIYFELIPLLSAAPPSLDDAVNNERRAKYRSLMRRLLSQRISIPQVVEILAAVEAGNWNALPRDAYNGLYSCIAVCRHAYRWATIPVVRVAQLEKIVEFPPELDVPWAYLQRNFGVDADAGNNTSNVLLNFNTRGERIYRINVGMSDVIRTSEEVFFQMFYDLEVVAFPIYYEMVRAVMTFEENNKAACLQHLQNINLRLRDLFRVFYDNLTKNKVSHSVWLSYVQGFQAWGVGKIVDGTYVRYDGLSGNHVLFFQALDAFLGIGRYLSDENMDRYIPVNQRALCLALKRHSFLKLAKAQNDSKINDEFTKMVNQLKVRMLFLSLALSFQHPYLKSMHVYTHTCRCMYACTALPE
ncbi:hypothetical protein ACMFMF_008830 [Clarireedia jacksonii]